jgi:hypothetical protein
MSDPAQLSEKLLTEAVRSLKADSGAVSLVKEGKLQIVHTSGTWKGDAYLSVPLNCGRHRHGLLQLGPHHPHQSYDRSEVDALQVVANQVARALCVGTDGEATL